MYKAAGRGYHATQYVSQCCLTSAQLEQNKQQSAGLEDCFDLSARYIFLLYIFLLAKFCGVVLSSSVHTYVEGSSYCLQESVCSLFRQISRLTHLLRYLVIILDSSFIVLWHSVFEYGIHY